MTRVEGWSYNTAVGCGFPNLIPRESGRRPVPVAVARNAQGFILQAQVMGGVILDRFYKDEEYKELVLAQAREFFAPKETPGE